MKSWQWKWKNRESMTTLRKKNKAFHSNVIDKLRKMCEKYPFYAKGLIVVPKTITRQRGNRLQTFIPRPSERRRLMLQQEGKWITCCHHFIFKSSIVAFQFPCNHNKRMTENVLCCTWTMLGLNSPCEIRRQPFKARPLSLKKISFPPLYYKKKRKSDQLMSKSSYKKTLAQCDLVFLR